MEITNQFHREMIEETCDFRLADSLGLKSCGVCAISGILTLVPDDAPAVQFHDYPGSLRCLPLPVCQSCGEEMDDEIDPGMYGCPDQGCQVAVEEWRAERAAQQDPLFYGYEAHPDAGPSRVTIVRTSGGATPSDQQEISTLSAPRKSSMPGSKRDAR